MFHDPLPSLPLHFLEHFLLVAFGATVEELCGLNINLYDSFTRECLVSNKLALKIMVAFERLLEDQPDAGWCWPTAEDKAAWDMVLQPAYPEGIPCTALRMSIILSGADRAHLQTLVLIPKVKALAARRTSSSFTRSNGDVMMRVPVSRQHLRFHHLGSVPQASPLHPTTILTELCSAFHPYLEDEMARKTTSRDAPRKKSIAPATPSS